MVRILAGCVTALLAVPAAAQAATVRGFPLGAVHVVDERGERNRIDVVGRRGVAVVERGRPRLRAVGTCRQVTPRRVRCPRGTDYVIVRAGGGDDRVTSGHRATLLGGAGDDVLLGGAGRQWLHGGAGDDVLDGGAGRDTASWRSSEVPLEVDLGRGTASSSRQFDRVLSIEDAVGGRRADRLIGTDGGNQLIGRGGADALIGLGGDDRLETSGRRDALECGAGADRVEGVAAVIPPGCERVSAADYGALLGNTIRVQPVRVSNGRVRMAVVCSLEYSHCRRRVTLRAGGEIVGRARRVVRPGVDRVRVRLRRPLPAGRVLTVSVRGPAYRLTYRLRLPEPPL